MNIRGVFLDAQRIEERWGVQLGGGRNKKVTGTEKRCYNKTVRGRKKSEINSRQKLKEGVNSKWEERVEGERLGRGKQQ